MKEIRTYMFFIILTAAVAKDIDPNGYITYCPCMGRFGNQADHFLGALAFAKGINRTLIVPPWVEYAKGKAQSIQVPYDKYFNPKALSKFHRVILMDDFMKNLAASVWPMEKRISFCYMERKSLNSENSKKDCHAKEGNPFGPFWDNFNITFFKSEFFGPLHYDVHHSSVAEEWKKKYSATLWPVLAFTGAPAPYPVQIENRQLQKYVIWNTNYINMANDFIKGQLPKGAFIGLHLRNGIDWVRACEHVRTSITLFASPQCLGYTNEKGNVYDELCYPSKEIIVRQIKRLIKKIKDTNKNNEIKSVFVASDSNHMIDELNQSLARMKVSAHKLLFDNPQLDLAILGMSNYFIGNCVSSFSAFIKRERDIKGFPSYFWAFPKEKEKSQSKNYKHEEL